MAHEIKRTADYDKNYWIPGDEWLTPCYICGRIIDQRKPHTLVHFGFGGWHAVTEEENATNEAGDLGFWPVGSECLRQQPELRPYAVKRPPMTHRWNGEPVPSIAEVPTRRRPSRGY